MVRLPWNEKQTYRWNSRHQMQSLGLIRAWLWTWIFKAKFWNRRISRIGGPIDNEQKGVIYDHDRDLLVTKMRCKDLLDSVGVLSTHPVGSDNGLSPDWCQAIIWTKAGILLSGPWETNFNEILIKIQQFLFNKMHLKMSSGKWQPFCLSLNVLNHTKHNTVQTACTFLGRYCVVTTVVSGESDINTLRPRQNGRHIPDDIFKWIFLNENVLISINISLKFVPRGPINNIPTLVQVMAWRRPGDKPLSEPMMVRLLTHICVTRPQWVNSLTPGRYGSNFKGVLSNAFHWLSSWALLVILHSDECQKTLLKASQHWFR